MVEKYPQCWREFLQKNLIENQQLQILREKLNSIEFYPTYNNIFNVFTMSIEDIKLVVLALDPYPHDAACGYAFALNDYCKKPVSFRVIEKELGHELDTNLQSWINQGVFLLNTALTVEKGKSGSHLNYWFEFTKELIKKISLEHPCGWLLMGKQAQSFEKYIENKEFNTIFRTPHPAAEAYSGGKAGFLGSGIFDQIKQKINIEL